MGEKINKKRVLFLITQSELGGAQQFLINLLPRLSRDDYEIMVGVGIDGDGEILDHLNEKNIPFYTIKTLRRNFKPFDDIRSVFAIRKVIKNFRPNTIFLCSSKAGFVGALAARTLSAPPKVIYRIGGWQFNDPRPAWQNNFYKFLEQISARWKDIIIVNNQHDLEQAKKFKIKPRDKLLLIHNGLDAYKMDFLGKEEARLKLLEQASKQFGKVFQSKYIVGTLANFYPSKGLRYLIEAANEFKDSDEIIFIIIGDGRERANLESAIKERGLEKHVFILGRINNAARYLMGFDIFVLPSVKEGFSWGILEAMAAKLPIIATRVGAAEEIIENSKNGFLVEPGDSQAIANSINSIITDSHLNQELGIQAHQTLLFRFDLEKMVSAIEETLS